MPAEGIEPLFEPVAGGAWMASGDSPAPMEIAMARAIGGRPNVLLQGKASCVSVFADR